MCVTVLCTARNRQEDGNTNHAYLTEKFREATDLLFIAGTQCQMDGTVTYLGPLKRCCLSECLEQQMFLFRRFHLSSYRNLNFGAYGTRKK